MLKAVANKLLGAGHSPQETLDRLTAEHRALQVRVREASEAWSAALAEEACGRGDEAATSRLEAELNAAQRELGRMEATLAALLAQREKAEATGRVNTLRDAWSSAVRAAENRAEKVRQAAKAAESLAKALSALDGANAELYAALPECPDHDAVLLRQNSVEIAVRTHLRRHGVVWAWDAIYGPEALPDMAKGFVEAVGVVKHWESAALSRVRG